MARRRLDYNGYKIGWVCALPIELAAAQEMLDEEHQDLSRDPSDTNLYTLGRIGDHNVVIACLPYGQMGTNSAAIVAIQMKSTFRAIQFTLMVGVGGGVPSTSSDIRLGDVVVSLPRSGHGGVIQYDFGKSTPSGFVRTGFLNSPPPILLNALAKQRANHYRGKSSISKDLSRFSHLLDFSRDSAGPDILFESHYDHLGGNMCDKCSRDKVVERAPRHHIVVHYGTIASGNQVVRDGATRDLLSSELGGVDCFEMEAAGIMNGFPCLVIRGICDYADSHKNKGWQPYAAAAAAACAKEVLSFIPEADTTKIHTRQGGLDGSLPESEAISGSLPKPAAGSQITLHKAAREGRETRVRVLLENGADISARDRKGRTALHVASSYGHTVIIQLLLNYGADLSAKDQYECTALHLAARHGHTATVQMLFEKGADLSAKDQYGCIALNPAAKNGHTATVQLLLEKGSDISAKDSYGRTALHVAASYGYTTTVQLLLEKGANISTKSEDGWTALYEAASYGHTATVRLLLDYGAGIPEKYQCGPTALHAALRNSHKATARLLLDCGFGIQNSEDGEQH